MTTINNEQMILNEKFLDEILKDCADIESIRALLDAGADIHVTNEDGETLLHAATRRGNAEILSLLLESGLKDSVNVADDEGIPPLYFAVFSGRTECARVLLSAGADIHATDKDGETLLHTAAQSENAEPLRLLLESGLKDAVNAVNTSGETALMLAVRSEEYDAIRLLLEHGADVYAADKQGKTALDRAENSPYLTALLREWKQR